MRDLVIDWSELKCDVLCRIAAHEERAFILGDLYHGVEAELASQNIAVSEAEIERLSKTIFQCCTYKPKAPRRFTPFHVRVLGFSFTV